MAGDIPQSQNGCIPGSALSATAAQQVIPLQPRRDECQVADTAHQGTLDTRPSLEEEQVVRSRSYWHNWAMGQFSQTGIGNPHQECCAWPPINT